MSTSYIEYFNDLPSNVSPEIHSQWAGFIDSWEGLNPSQAIEILHRVKNGEDVHGFSAFEKVDALRTQRWGAELIQHRGAQRFVCNELLSIPFAVASAQAALPRLFSKTAVREGFVTVDALLSKDWLRCFTFDHLLRDREESLFSHEMNTRTAHRIALAVLIKIEVCKRSLDEQLSKEIVGQAIVYALTRGQFEAATKLLLSRVKVFDEKEIEDLSQQAKMTAYTRITKDMRGQITDWLGSVSDPQFVTVAPPGDLEVIAVTTLAAFGKFRYLPLAVSRDYIAAIRTANNPETGRAYNHTEKKFEAVEVTRLDHENGESFAARQNSIEEATQSREVFQRVQQLRQRIDESSPIQKVRTRRKKVLDRMIEDPEISSADLAREFKRRGLEISDDRIEADRAVIARLFAEILISSK